MPKVTDEYCMSPYQFIFAQDSNGNSLCSPVEGSTPIELTHICRSTQQQINIIGKQIDGFDVKVFDTIHTLFSSSMLSRDPLQGTDADQWVLISSFDKIAKSMGIRNGPAIRDSVHNRLAASLKKFTAITYRISTIGFDAPTAAPCRIEPIPLVGTFEIFKDDHELKAHGDFLIKLNPLSNKLQVLNDDGQINKENHGQYSHLVRADALGCTNYSSYQILRRLSHQVQMPKTQHATVRDIQLDTLVAWCFGTGLTGQKLRNARHAVIKQGLPQIDALANWNVTRGENTNTFRFSRLTKPKTIFK